MQTNHGENVGTSFFAFFGIDIQRFKDWKYLSGVLLLFAMTLLLSYRHTKNLTLATDFAVFWHAGNNFKSSFDLYSNIGGADRFIYPPFAAWFFQIFAWLPMQKAGFFWCFLNFGLYAATVRVTYQLFSYYNIGIKKLKVAIFIAFILSFRYFWYHQMYVQMNLLMLYLCLEGILAYLKGRENKAIFLIMLATFIKILPIFFLFWIFVRGNWKTATKMAAFASIFILIPTLWRGFEQGFQDHLNYYAAFLEPFQNGRVEPKLNNYSLSAMIFKWCLPITTANGQTFQLLHFDLAQANLMYKTCFASLMLVFFALLWRSRRNFPTPHFSEIIFIFCLLHLISGISWEYHFVSLFVVFVPLGLLLQEKTLPFGQKITLYGITLIALLIGIDGQDTVGKTLHLLFNHYSIITILTLMMLFFSLWLCRSKSV